MQYKSGFETPTGAMRPLLGYHGLFIWFCSPICITFALRSVFVVFAVFLYVYFGVNK